MDTIFHTVMSHFLDLNEYLVPYVEKSVIFKEEYLSNLLEPISNVTGVDDKQLLFFVLALFASYPLAILLASIQSVTVKHFLSFIVGLFFTQTIYGVQWIHSFLSATVTYLIVAWAPQKKVGLYVLLFTMTYMSIAHIYRMYVDYMGWSMDFTALQMVLTIKFISFAYNVADGSEAGKKEAIIGIQKNAKAEKMYKQRADLAIEEIPSFLAYMGYVYCFTTSLAGPAFEFMEYKRVLEKPYTKKGTKSASLLPALKKLLTGVLFMALHLKGGNLFPSDACESDKMDEKSFIYRFLYMYIALFFVRCKYYFAWKVAEGSCILAGFGFEGYNDKEEIKGFNGVSNIDVLGFEFAANTVEASRAWNQGTQKWLLRYVYSRFGRSLLINYFISALWHGFYSGYFIFFLSIAFYTNAERMWKEKIKPYFVSSNDNDQKEKKKTTISFLWDTLGIFVWVSYINYFAISFNLLSFERAITVYKKLYFSGHILMVAAIALCMIVPKKKVRTM